MESSTAAPKQCNLKQYRLQVSRYDRVASMLLSLLTLIGVAVLMLAVIWLTNQIFSRQTAVPVVMEEIGTGDTTFREGPELEEPTPEEIQEEIDMSEPVLGDTLSSISNVVSENASMLDDPTLGKSIRPGGRFASGGRPGKPRHWEFRFGKGNTLENYARQLDYFGIELAVLMPGNKVLYASNLSKAKPTQRTGPADEEKRYYLTWRRGELQAADRELLEKAGIDVGDKLILKFIPPDLEARLSAMEKSRAGSEVENIRTTFFGVRPSETGYEFYVAEQTYQWGKKKPNP